MHEKLLTLDGYYKREYDFMIGELSRHRFTYAESESGKRLELYVAILDEEEGRILFSILEEVILTSMKYRYYKSELNLPKAPIDVALGYALLDFDSMGERRFIYENVYPKPSLHLDALYNFSLKELKSVWAGYVELVRDFYSNNPTIDEKCELIAYMYAMGAKGRIRRKSRFYLSDDEEEILLQKIFFYREKVAQEIEEHENIKKITKKIFG